jgi:arylsulfatase A-like enzyme
MDELARQGTVFEQMVTCAPSTGVAHASLMTGVYPTRHRIADNLGALPEDLVTLAQVCRAAGYDTAAFVSNPVLDAKRVAGIDRGFGLYDATLPSMERNRNEPYRQAPATTAAVEKWIAGRPKTPFFLWVHLMEPHGPYEVPDAGLLKRFGESSPRPGDPPSLPVLKGNFGPGGIPAYQALGDERDPARYRARYAARVAYVDRYVGRIVEAARRRDLLDHTVVALTSDHGELLGEHAYFFQHGITVLQPVLRIPLIVVAPGLDGGRRISSGASIVDLLPTLCALLGIGSGAAGPQLQGRTLVPLMRGKPEAEPPLRYAICATTGEWCVVSGRHKYTRRGDKGQTEGRLVDLVSDPAESTDVSRRDPATATRLSAALAEFSASAPGLFREPPRSRLTEEERLRLRSLGYLQ